MFFRTAAGIAAVKTGAEIEIRNIEGFKMPADFGTVGTPTGRFPERLAKNVSTS